ncbi:MAG: hypothetical protein AB1634_04555 [Thermodesulfobacteriota bacterium]
MRATSGRLGTAWLVTLAGLLAFLAACRSPAPASRVAPPEPSGAALFRAKCAGCHEPERALAATRSEAAWLTTINRMREEHQADISLPEVQALVRYHVERQQEEAKLFARRCEGCHPGRKVTDKALSPEQIRELVRRMQEKAGNTITDPEVEILIAYHIREHRTTLQRDLALALGRDPEKPGGPIALFLDKCSSCHEPERALGVFQDQDAWHSTLVVMQRYSKGAISDADVEELVAFHVDQQRREVQVFETTCSACHPAERATAHSLSDEEWLELIRRMQSKAPDLISDEKIRILMAYHRRREATLSRLFLGRCAECHLFPAGDSQGHRIEAMERLIGTAVETLGSSVMESDLDQLRGFHQEREKRLMARFSQDGKNCHTGLAPGRQEGRSRHDWAVFLSALEGEPLTPDREAAIGTRIDFHVLERRGEAR